MMMENSQTLNQLKNDISMHLKEIHEEVEYGTD